MTIVIPYRQTTDDGLELRYAIRSMVMHFKDMTGLVIVGGNPSWYEGDHIPCEDVYGRKEFSIYNKLMKVQGVVMYFNDDFFALQPFGADLPNYYNGTCGSYGGKDKSYAKLYQSCDPSWLNFDIHCPMVINTTKFEWICDRPIKSYYANQNKLPGTRLIDVKITGDIPELTGPFFSSFDNGERLLPLLNELYPKPSEYEI